MTADVAEAMSLRLRADLKVAMQARDNLDVRVLRALIAAIDNAQAVPVASNDLPAGMNRFVDGSVEVARAALSQADMQALLIGEVEARRDAADAFRALDRQDRADLLLAEAEIVRRYLSS